MKALGFKPKVFPHVGEATRYLAGPDEHRAADLNAAFADPSVDAIFCLHGGYGASRILPLLDYETIKKNPKVLCGYSDITALLNAIHRLTGLVTFHGPVGSEVADGLHARVLPEGAHDGAARGPHRRAAGAEGPAEGDLRRPRELDLQAGARERRRAGSSAGTSASSRRSSGRRSSPSSRAGSSSSRRSARTRTASTAGSRSSSSRASSPASRASRSGSSRTARPGDYKPSYAGYGQWTWQEVCKDRLGKLGIPVVANLVFGHVPDKATLPLGVMAELDGDAGTLTLLEAAVR